MRTSAFLSIILLSSLSHGLTSLSHDLTRRPRLRNLHSSVIAGDWIYIDGGEVSDKKGVFTPENQTLAIDLSISWTNSSLNLISTDRPVGAVPLNRQTLWWDEKHKTIYCFGGEKSYGNRVGDSYSTPPESIWKFTPDSNGKGSGNWTEAVGSTSTHTFPSELVRVAGGISAHDGSNAYYLGGYVTAATSPKVNFLHDAGLADVPGMLNFDFDSLDISNATVSGNYASQYKSGNWLDIGAMLSVPKYGPDGIFVLLGGEENAFNNITIYDKKSQTWHNQTATGAIPAPRTLFCAVVVQNNYSHSYEIFIHGGVQGGLGGPKNKDSDETYILTIPAFQWFQANYTSLSPRAGHTCHPAGNNQMILIGGSDPTQFTDNTMEAWNGTADPWTQGIGVFDLSNLVWKDAYNANAKPYTVPRIVKQYYDQNGSYPLTWSSPDVQALFQPSLNNNTAPPKVVPHHHQISSGVIFAIAVGCITIVLICGTVAFVLLRRKRVSSTDESHAPRGHKVSELTGSDVATEMSNNQLAELSGKQLVELPDKGQIAEMDAKCLSIVIVEDRLLAELATPDFTPLEKDVEIK